jgi:hypothetical protein
MALTVLGVRDDGNNRVSVKAIFVVSREIASRS